MKVSSFTKKRKDNILGGIVGFMIGDALGLPLSGLRTRDIKKMIGLPITSYVENPYHPFLFFIKKGQYGSNTRLMLLLLKSLLEEKKYNRVKVTRDLINDAKKSKADYVFSRYIGETTLKALLVEPVQTGQSMTAALRSIPLALFSSTLEDALQYTDIYTQITHRSPVSRAATAFLTFLIFNNLSNPRKSIIDIAKEALSFIQKTYTGIDNFTTPLSSVLSGKYRSIRQAKKHIGTGSAAFQTIPLALYILLNQRNIKKALLTAVNNTGRDHSQEEEFAIRGMSYFKEILDLYGGNADGVCSIIGCVLGTRKGYSFLPTTFTRSLEDRNKVINQVSKHLFTLSPVSKN